MKARKNTLIALYILTLLTALSSVYLYGWRFLISIILGLSALKFILVAFQFMEIKKAHGFWKFFVIFYVTVFVLAVSIILH